MRKKGYRSNFLRFVFFFEMVSRTFIPFLSSLKISIIIKVLLNIFQTDTHYVHRNLHTQFSFACTVINLRNLHNLHVSYTIIFSEGYLTWKKRFILLWEQIEIWLSGSHYLTQKSSLKNIFSLKGNELVYKLLRLIFKCLVLAMPQPVFTKFKPALFFKCEERGAFFFLIMWTFYINFVNWGEIENCTFLIIIANFVLKLHFCQLLSVYQWILFCTQDNTDQTVLHSKLASVSWKHEFKCHLAFTLESGKKWSLFGVR